jgi:hypothetical protein
MSNTLKLTGKKFGRLTVLEKAPNKICKKSIFSMWKCLCDCGKICVVYGSTINKGKVNSCGCLKIEKARRNPGEAGFNDLYNEYRKRATKYNRDFVLTKADFFLYTQMDCFYCGVKPSNIHISHHDRSEKSIKHESYTYNGLDRVDSDGGYTIDNITTSCKTCNWAKNNMSQEDFLNWIKNIYERHCIK